MPGIRPVLVIFLLLVSTVSSQAGVYNPAEGPLVPQGQPSAVLNQIADLRGLGPPDPLTGQPESTARRETLAKVRRLQENQGRLSAEDAASLGAYLIRLRRTQPGQENYEEALRVLEEARRLYPRDFRILANLGTAYQLTGRLDAAASCLQEALEYAPDELRRSERYHLLLVRQRAQEQAGFGLVPLDRLFFGPDRRPIHYVGEDGTWRVGQLATAERAKLPAESVDEALQIVGQLLLWLPDDGRLLWQFGELANAKGDLRAAAEALHQAVYVYRLSTPEVKEHRFWLQEAVTWREVARRAGSAEEQAAWALRSILLAGSCNVPAPDALGPGSAVALRVPAPADPIFPNAFGGGDDAVAPPAPAAAPVDLLASLGWQGWTAIAVGGLIVLLLIGLQLRELFRRRAARPVLRPSGPAARGL